MLSLIFSFFLSLWQELSPRTMPQDYLAWWLLAVPSPPGRAAAPVSTVLPAALESWPVHRTCYLSQTCCFQLSRDSRSGRDTLNVISYEKPTDIYSWGADLLCNHCDYYYLTLLVIYEHLNILAMFCYNLYPAQPEEDWPPLIAWFLSRFLPRLWPF